MAGSGMTTIADAFTDARLSNEPRGDPSSASLVISEVLRLAARHTSSPTRARSEAPWDPAPASEPRKLASNPNRWISLPDELPIQTSGEADAGGAGPSVSRAPAARMQRLRMAFPPQGGSSIRLAAVVGGEITRRRGKAPQFRIDAGVRSRISDRLFPDEVPARAYAGCGSGGL